MSSDVRLACNRSVHMAAVSTWLDTPDKRNEWEAPWRGEAGCNFIWGEVCDADDFPLGAGFDATDVAPGTYAVWTRVWVDLRTGNAQQGGPAWLLMPTAEHDRSYESTGCLPVTAPVVAGPAQLDYANCVFRDEVVLG